MPTYANLRDPQGGTIVRRATCAKGMTYVVLRGDRYYFVNDLTAALDSNECCFSLYAPVTDDARIDAHFANSVDAMGGYVAPRLLFINQGRRPCTTIATIGNRALLEYAMPAGRVFLTEERLDLVGLPQRARTYSYRSVPKYWLKACDAPTRAYLAAQALVSIPTQDTGYVAATPTAKES